MLCYLLTFNVVGIYWISGKSIIKKYYQTSLIRYQNEVIILLLTELQSKNSS